MKVCATLKSAPFFRPRNRTLKIKWRAHWWLVWAGKWKPEGWFENFYFVISIVYLLWLLRAPVAFFFLPFPTLPDAPPSHQNTSLKALIGTTTACQSSPILSLVSSQQTSGPDRRQDGGRFRWQRRYIFSIFLVFKLLFPLNCFIHFYGGLFQ